MDIRQEQAPAHYGPSAAALPSVPVAGAPHQANY